MSKRSREDVDRLGSWYTAPKCRKVTPVDKVTAIMAPRNGVLGNKALDKMGEVMRKAPKVGNRKFKEGRAYKPRIKKQMEEGEGVYSVAEGKLGRVMRKMPVETKIGNPKQAGCVYPIPDIKLDPNLAAAVSMAKEGSPLDSSNPVALPNLQHRQHQLLKNYKRKLPGLNLRRKITKGGRTFVSFKNILVTPEAAP
jgi:hypothetical protein